MTSNPNTHAVSLVTATRTRWKSVRRAVALGLALRLFSLPVLPAAEPPPTAKLNGAGGIAITGELKQWHKVTLLLDGPEVAEAPATFRDYRLNVIFSKGGEKFIVPGHFAADGNAAETGADRGNKWRVFFSPKATGVWSYRVSFRTGPDVALSLEADAGAAWPPLDGKTGTFVIGPTDKQAPDFRGRGLLRYTGKHYQQFAGDNSYWLAIGPGSPEDLFGGSDFDATRTGMKPQYYADHIQDWKPGDPTWGNGRGKGVIGALNYVIALGQSSMWAAFMNAFCDCDDTWPYPEKDISVKGMSTFDVSKLDQWEIVVAYGQKHGLVFHAIMSEEEAEGLWEKVEGLTVGGASDFAKTRKLYYREIVSRFAHFNAVDWNMGEEFGLNNAAKKTAPNGGWPGTSDGQKKLFTDYVTALDPYGHSRGWEGAPNAPLRDYTPWFKGTEFNRTAIQGTTTKANEYSVTLREASAAAGHPWVINFSEHHRPALALKTLIATNYPVFRQSVWGTFLGGGAGMEWYLEGDDYFLVSYRPYREVLRWTAHVRDFMYAYLPFWEMEPANALLPPGAGYCFAKKGFIYALYLNQAGAATLDLTGETGTFVVLWYDPRNGGALQSGAVRAVQGGSLQTLGQPPKDADLDWAVLVRRQSAR